MDVRRICRFTRLAKKSSCGPEQATSAPGEPRGCVGVRNGGRRSASQSGVTAECPLASDQCVVAKGCERKTLRSPAANARGLHMSERPPRAERIRAEMPRPPGHPAWVPAAGAEADSARVQGDPVGPRRQRHAEPRVTTACGSGKQERDCDEPAQDKDEPTPRT